MTYRQALKVFKEKLLPHLPTHDKPAQREAWVNYIDGLARTGAITDKQARTWDNPF